MIKYLREKMIEFMSLNSSQNLRESDGVLSMNKSSLGSESEFGMSQNFEIDKNT